MYNTDVISYIIDIMNNFEKVLTSTEDKIKKESRQRIKNKLEASSLVKDYFDEGCIDILLGQKAEIFDLEEEANLISNKQDYYVLYKESDSKIFSLKEASAFEEVDFPCIFIKKATENVSFEIEVPILKDSEGSFKYPNQENYIKEHPGSVAKDNNHYNESFVLNDIRKAYVYFPESKK